MYYVLGVFFITGLISFIKLLMIGSCTLKKKMNEECSKHVNFFHLVIFLHHSNVIYLQ